MKLRREHIVNKTMQIYIKMNYLPYNLGEFWAFCSEAITCVMFLGVIDFLSSITAWSYAASALLYHRDMTGIDRNSYPLRILVDYINLNTHNIGRYYCDYCNRQWKRNRMSVNQFNARKHIVDLTELKMAMYVMPGRVSLLITCNGLMLWPLTRTLLRTANPISYNSWRVELWFSGKLSYFAPYNF